MPTWSVDCTEAYSDTGKPEYVCTYGADPFKFLDISRVLTSL